MDKLKWEKLLFIRINRLLWEYKVLAPSIIIKNELALVENACRQVLLCYE